MCVTNTFSVAAFHEYRIMEKDESIVLTRSPLESYSLWRYRHGSLIATKSDSLSDTSSGVATDASSQVDEEEDDGGGYSTCSETWEESWSAVNERKVSDITLHSFYRPRTLTLLGATIVILFYVAFLRDQNQRTTGNVAAGLAGVCFFFLTTGLLIFPNGPFTRPHPIVWRLVFGISILYLLFMEFLLFQSLEDVMALLHYVAPGLKSAVADSHTMIYTRICELTESNIWSHLDVFIPCHVLGWLMKALLIRHYGMVWAISLMWELTEVFFEHILPNFGECWWDTLILDLLVCNGIGIHIGMRLIGRLEMKHFHWESIKNIKGVRGKLKRAVLQFTPEQWSRTRWLDPASTYMRAVAIFFLILVFQVNELNCFLLKHVFYIPTSHYLNLLRLIIICLIAAPSIRQYYVYVTDETCTRLGSQVWVFIAITVTELLVSIKFGMTILPRPAFLYLIAWLMVVALVSVGITAIITMYEPWWRWTKLVGVWRKSVKPVWKRRRRRRRRREVGNREDETGMSC